MAAPGPTGPNAVVLVTQVYLVHLQGTKNAREKEVQECERILSIFRSHVAHKEKKIRGEVPAKQAIHEVIDLTGDDEEDVPDAETSGDESESESDDDPLYPQRINGNNHYTPGAFDDSDSEEETEEERRKKKPRRDGLRRIQRGNATPCTDDSHLNWCVHAKDLRYHNHYDWLGDSEVEDEDDSDGDAMSVESDAQPVPNEAGNAVLEDGNKDEALYNTTPQNDARTPVGNESDNVAVADGNGDDLMNDPTLENVAQSTVNNEASHVAMEDGHEDEAMDEPTPPTTDESAGSGAKDNQSTSLIDLASSNQEDDTLKASSDADLASNNEQYNVPEASSVPDNTTSEEATKTAAAEELARAKSQMTALRNKLVILKDSRKKLNAVLDPKIAEVTGKLSSPEGCEALRELGFLDALEVFREAAQGVDKLCKQILEAEKAALSGDGAKDARESSEETEERGDIDIEPEDKDDSISEHQEANESSEEIEHNERDENVEFEDNEGSVNEGEEAAGGEGDVEALEESEQPTSTAQGAAVFNIPIIGGKRDREEDEEAGEAAVKRARLEDST